MKKSTRQIYLKNASRFGWGPSNYLADYRFKELTVHLKGKKILDIGCGYGHLTHLLSTQGFEATGIDTTPEFIDYASRHHQGKYILADACHLPFKHRQFDTVFLISTLEHLKQDSLALKEALRIASRLIIVVPQTAPLALTKRGLVFSHYQDTTHIRTYTPSSFKKLIKKAGGRLIALKQIEPLPIKTIFSEIFIAPAFIRRIVAKLFFLIFKPVSYHLELLAIIEP